MDTVMLVIGIVILNFGLICVAWGFLAQKDPADLPAPFVWGQGFFFVGQGLLFIIPQALPPGRTQNVLFGIVFLGTLGAVWAWFTAMRGLRASSAPAATAATAATSATSATAATSSTPASSSPPT